VVPAFTVWGREGDRPKETLGIPPTGGRLKDPWRFLAANMSDGTGPGAGNSGGIIPVWKRRGPPCRLVGIEEPEIALHPAAAGLLRDGLRGGQRSTQVSVTATAGTCWNDEQIDADSILASRRRGIHAHRAAGSGGRTALVNPL